MTLNDLGIVLAGSWQIVKNFSPALLVAAALLWYGRRETKRCQ